MNINQSYQLSIWKPTPPPNGYIAMGYVFQDNYEEPNDVDT